MTTLLLTNGATGLPVLVNLSPESWAFVEPIKDLARDENGVPLINSSGSAPIERSKIWFHNGKFLIVKETIREINARL
jgi:hypothetical protein